MTDKPTTAPDIGLAITASARTKTEREATAFLAANDNKPARGRTPVFRGGRPALNWAKKQDDYAAACLWLVARERLPLVASNDNQPTDGMSLDTRRNGQARGPSATKTPAERYMALPAVQPRLGEGEPLHYPPIGETQWWLEVKPQRRPEDYELYPFGRFTRCADAIAPGAEFIGAKGGLGQPKAGKKRGDPRPVEAGEWPDPPADVDHVIELILSRSNLGEIGQALGAKGRYADKVAKKAIRAALDWAVQAVENSCAA